MKALIVEDDVEFGKLLIKAMENAGWIADHAVDGQEGLSFAESGYYDVIILDWILPKLSGLELLQLLRQKAIAVPAIMTSARSVLQDKLQGLNQGADDYIVKPFELEEFMARLNALMRRSVSKGASRIELGSLVLDVDSQCYSLSGRKLEFTPKEFDLLTVLMSRRGQLVKRATLIAMTYQWVDKPESNSIDVLMMRIRKKISGSGVEVVTVRGKGFILRSTESSMMPAHIPGSHP